MSPEKVKELFVGVGKDRLFWEPQGCILVSCDQPFTREYEAFIYQQIHCGKINITHYPIVKALILKEKVNSAKSASLIQSY